MSAMAIPNITVSIIIPVYNVASYLDRCLSSCIQQTYATIEIICVNDGSVDGSQRIIDAYGAKDPRVRSIQKVNEGLPLARKTGIASARGEYVLHLDGDDFLVLDAIEVLVKKALETRADLIIGDYVWYEAEQQQRVVAKYAFDVIGGTEFLKLLLTVAEFFIWGKLIRRDLYAMVDIPRGTRQQGEDLVGMTQLAWYADRVAKVNVPVYYYVQQSASMCHQLSSERLKDFHQNCVHVKSFMCQVGAMETLVQEFNLFWLRQINVYLVHADITGWYRADIRRSLWTVFRSSSLCRYVWRRFPASTIAMFALAVCSQRLASCFCWSYRRLRAGCRA